MGQLTNQYVSSSFQGLLKMTDSTQGLTNTLQTIQTGDGDNSPLQMSLTEVNISGSFYINNVPITNGTNGTSGTSGSSGSDGTDGSSGTSGSNGTDGTSGSSGTDGTSGSNGTDGTSGTSSSIDTGSFATTGSNRFDGDQRITGAIIMAEDNSVVFKSGSNASGISVSDGGSNISMRYDNLSFNSPNGEMGMSSRDNLNIGSTNGTIVYSTQNGQVSYFGPNGIFVNNSDNSSNTHIYTEPSGSGKSNVVSNSDLTIKAGNSGTNRMDLNGDLYINNVQYTTGSIGSSGTSGTDGTSGSNGTDGSSGTSGTDGTSGSNGTDGSSGTSGLTDKTGLITTGSIATTQSISGSLRVTGSITGSNDIQVNSITIGRGGGNIATNTAVGKDALRSNVLGTENIAIGSGSLTGLISGSNNIAIGNFTLQTLSGSNALAQQNVIIGNVSGINLINGVRNTIIGHQALGGDNVNRNTGIGRGVLVGLNGTALAGFGSGSQYNVGVGHNAGFSFNSGSNNVFINGGTASGEGLRSGSNNTVVGATALPVEMNNSTIIGLISSAATIGTSPVTNSVVIADGQGNVMVRKDGSTGTVKFPTSVEITGSLLLSGSALFDLIVTGAAKITNQTALAELTMSPSSFNVNSTKTVATGAEGFIFGSTGSNAQFYLGVYDDPNFTTDVELNIKTDSNGILFNDWDNGNTFSYVPFMTLAPNTGNNPIPQFTRGLVVTGSLTVTGGINYSSGSNQTVGTAVLDGANPGTVTVSNSLVTTSSLIFLTKQTLTNAHMVAVSSKGSGTFTITSNGNGDADTVAYQIINPA